jgi:hypothetical protein
MLRHAIEHSPSDLQKLDEVLKLPKRKQQELATLLDETDLSGIISAAKLVADRLKFLQGLQVILFDHEAKDRLKERSQLHKILESNTWIFGEEFNLWASDRELTTVLNVIPNPAALKIWQLNNASIAVIEKFIEIKRVCLERWSGHYLIVSLIASVTTEDVLWMAVNTYQA